MGGCRKTGGNIAMITAEYALKAVFWIVTRWALAGVFIYAGFVKDAQVESFAASIARFQIVPASFIHPLALALPPLEMLCGIALLSGPWKRQAAFSIALLSGIFLMALTSAGMRGIEVECTCFGSPSPEPLWRSIARDCVLLMASSAVYVRTLLRRRSPIGELSTPLDRVEEIWPSA
jgi:putative oxidoreductase